MIFLFFLMTFFIHARPRPAWCWWLIFDDLQYMSGWINCTDIYIYSMDLPSWKVKPGYIQGEMAGKIFAPHGSYGIDTADCSDVWKELPFPNHPLSAGAQSSQPINKRNGSTHVNKLTFPIFHHCHCLFWNEPFQKHHFFYCLSQICRVHT